MITVYLGGSDGRPKRYPSENNGDSHHIDMVYVVFIGPLLSVPIYWRKDPRFILSRGETCKQQEETTEFL